MSDPVLTFVLLGILFAAVAAARYFKSLNPDFWGAATSPALTGVVCGLLLMAASGHLRFQAIATGVLLTLGAAYVRHTGDESDPAEGMLLGALTGAAAVLPAAFWRGASPRYFSETVIAGAIAGYGITFASFHVRQRTRQAALDLLTVVLSVAGAWLPQLLEAKGLAGRETAIAVTISIPVLSLGSVLLGWKSVRREIEDESVLGFVDALDVRGTAHPLLRFGRGGWSDAAAHRAFVRTANKIALRKRQQRNRSSEEARLYQLEIIKLRMRLEEMRQIGRATGKGQSNTGGDSAAVG